MSVVALNAWNVPAGAVTVSIWFTFRDRVMVSKPVPERTVEVLDASAPGVVSAGKISASGE